MCCSICLRNRSILPRPEYIFHLKSHSQCYSRIHKASACNMGTPCGSRFISQLLHFKSSTLLGKAATDGKLPLMLEIWMFLDVWFMINSLNAYFACIPKKHEYTKLLTTNRVITKTNFLHFVPPISTTFFLFCNE